MELDKKNSKRLARFCSGLPDKKLQKLARSLEAQQIWLQLNDNATLLGKCLAVRARRIGGDPISQMLKGDESDKLRHFLTWSLATKYETLFDLIQLCWQPISDVLRCLDSAPSSELALFLEVIEEFFNCTFSICVDGGTYKPYEFERSFLLQKKLLNRYPKPKDVDEQTLQKTASEELAGNVVEFLDLCSKQPGVEKGVFYPILLKIFGEESKSNDVVRNTLHSYVRQEGDIADALHKGSIKARKEGGLTSQKWLPGGQLLTGTRGGRYVTKTS